MAAWVGRKRRGTTGVPWWKPILAAGNGSSVMRCARKPTSVKQPKWHSLSTSSTACWRWDARATSAFHETTRTGITASSRLIHATRSLGASKPTGNVVLRSFEFALPIEPDPYDPEQAKKLLAEAGYPRGF